VGAAPWTARDALVPLPEARAGASPQASTPASVPPTAPTESIADSVRAFYLRRNVNWFDPEERASLLVGE